MNKTILSFGESIAANYEELLGPFLFEPYAEDMAGRIRNIPSSDILELACGTGRLTWHLAAGLASGQRLTATDINPGMLSEAQRRLPDSGIRWATADMAAIPYRAGDFDLVVSQFGLMFPADRSKALQEIRRVLRKGGRLVFNTWGPAVENPVWVQLGKVMRSVFGDGASGPMEQLFSLSDEGQVMQLLEDNGFAEVSAHRVRMTGSIESAALAAKGMIAGSPVMNMVKERAPDALPGMLEQLEALYAEVLGDHPARTPLSARVFEARVVGE